MMIRPELTMNTVVIVIPSLTLRFLYTVMLVERATIFQERHASSSCKQLYKQHTHILPNKNSGIQLTLNNLNVTYILLYTQNVLLMNVEFSMLCF
jgi:hypothetical protein